ANRASCSASISPSVVRSQEEMDHALLRQQSAFGGRGAPKPLDEGGPRMPESLARGFRRVHTGTQYLDWTGRGRADARRRSEDRGKRIQKLIHARRDSGADVEDPRVDPREGPEDGLDHVRDVHVVALVAAVPEDRDWLAPFPAADEDRDHPALEVPSLARPVDVRKTERHCPQVRRSAHPFGLRLQSAVVRRRIHRYVQWTAAPSSRSRVSHGTVDEIVEEKVDKPRGDRNRRGLRSVERAELPPRSRRGGGSLSISERLF